MILLQRGHQSKMVQAGRAQVDCQAMQILLNRAGRFFQFGNPRADHFRITRITLQQAKLDSQCRHKLAGLIMQFARKVKALILLGFHQALGEGVQLAVGHPHFLKQPRVLNGNRRQVGSRIESGFASHRKRNLFFC